MTHCTGLLGILNSTAEQLSLNLMRLQLTSKHERNKQQVWFERTSNFTAGNTNSLGKGVFCKHVEDAHIWGTAVQKGFQVGPYAGTWRHFMPLSDQEFTIQFHKIFLWSVSWHAFLDITLGKVKKKMLVSYLYQSLVHCILWCLWNLFSWVWFYTYENTDLFFNFICCTNLQSTVSRKSFQPS